MQAGKRWGLGGYACSMELHGSGALKVGLEPPLALEHYVLPMANACYGNDPDRATFVASMTANPKRVFCATIHTLKIMNAAVYYSSFLSLLPSYSTGNSTSCNLMNVGAKGG